VFDLEVGGEALVVVSLPVKEDVPATTRLSPAERAVSRQVLAGLSNAAIARRRGCSPRTIANQLAAVYRKLGVSSRAELAAKLSRDGEEQEAEDRESD
jgi:DNA-binding CsgD family transcriptional regulator